MSHRWEVAVLSSSDPGGFWTFFMENFVDRNADTLLGRVDFAGIATHTGRAAVLAVFTGIITVVLAIRQAFGGLATALEFFLSAPVEAITAGVVGVQRTAIAVTSGAIAEQGFLGLPFGVAVVLVSIGIVAFAIMLARGSG